MPPRRLDRHAPTLPSPRSLGPVLFTIKKHVCGRLGVVFLGLTLMLTPSVRVSSSVHVKYLSSSICPRLKKMSVGLAPPGLPSWDTPHPKESVGGLRSRCVGGLRGRCGTIRVSSAGPAAAALERRAGAANGGCRLNADRCGAVARAWARL